MKKFILFFAMMALFGCMMAQEVRSYSVYDTDQNGELNETDATQVIQQVVSGNVDASSTPQYVTAEDLKAFLQVLDTKLEKLNQLEKLADLEQNINSLALVAELFCGNMEGQLPENYPCHLGHEYVDLGLKTADDKPIYWATCNVGANVPEECGDYFAWGETFPYYASGHAQDQNCTAWRSIPGRTNLQYDANAYKYCNGTGTSKVLTKYCTNSSFGYEGFTDDKNVLETEDDAAHANWGGLWRMPTQQELEQLLTCDWEPTQLNGVSGYTITGANGNSIFLPITGFRRFDKMSEPNKAFYWSSSLYTDSQVSAVFLKSRQDNAGTNTPETTETNDPSIAALLYIQRCYGMPIRPVLIK